ncbi:MAG: excinuclease ABC subunit UvrA [Bacteroidaceae bacterium]|nr:excinuclease ABC subunit UvrA [Bacteroidaceae bacterium]
MDNSISIKRARVNNLRDVSLDIPRDQLVVVTGVSGSGKSSLAFDTLYAEGQRRYVESLSAYARQFLGRMHKPECDYIKGLPPAIAIEQKVSTRNPRSTVGTSTEIYDYLRMLFARVGRTYSPVSGEEVQRHTIDSIVEDILGDENHAAGERFVVLSSITLPEGRTMEEQLNLYQQQGFSRVFQNDSVVGMADADVSQPCQLLVARCVVDASKEGRQMLTDSVETALFEGRGECMVHYMRDGEERCYNTRFELDGITFQEPTDQLFSFNSPAGACPECEGFGRVMGIDEQLVVPNSTLSVYDGCVQCWRGEKMQWWKDEFIRCTADKGFPIFTPYCELTREQKDWLWHGIGNEVDYPDWRPMEVCIDAFFRDLQDHQYKIQNRVMLARYRGRTTCPRCGGARLRPEALYVRINGQNIAQLCDKSVDELAEWFGSVDADFSEQEHKASERLLKEIRSRLRFLQQVGLGYLTLSRLSNSLSGGESQRINLATSLGSSLVGSLYILDEPSIGLHPRDTQQLIDVLKELRDLGNTVIVVEHDSQIISQADWIVEIGPGAGQHGGTVTYSGVRTEPLPELPLNRQPRPWNRSLLLRGARANNLKGIDVEFPLNVMTCVTGVSGSGKSTLIRDILYRALKRHFDEPSDRPGEYLTLEGDLDALAGVEFVDQNPIGRSSRSNPVTYLKAWDEIRQLMARQPLSEQLDLTPAHFSFNAEGGRCEECKGEGTVRVEMQFMADLVLECEACHGQRFKHDVLEVRYEGKNVYDILQMTVDEAIDFFQQHGERKIVRRLLPLQQVGLGYIRLGQSSSTLSGGESQRVKLAYYLSQEAPQSKGGRTLFVFDEPTTGLHFDDIRKLLDAFSGLIERGHSVLCIEHNLDVIRQADWIIDLGPEGGDQGGQLVAAGTPADLASSGCGYTSRYICS